MCGLTPPGNPRHVAFPQRHLVRTLHTGADRGPTNHRPHLMPSRTAPSDGRMPLLHATVSIMLAVERASSWAESVQRGT